MNVSDFVLQVAYFPAGQYGIDGIERILRFSGNDNLGFDVSLRIAETERQHKTIKLRFGQWKRAVKIHRVLGRNDDKRPRQRTPAAFDRYLPLTHRFEQRGLCSGRRPVDFIGQKYIAENRPRTKIKTPGNRIVNG